MRLLCALLLALMAVATPRPAAAQIDPVADCFCIPRPGTLTGGLPRNAAYLVDGTRYDPASIEFLQIVDRQTFALPVRLEPFFSTGAYLLTYDQLFEPGSYVVTGDAATWYPLQVLGHNLDVRDFIDEEPPQVVSIEVSDTLINSCGAQALVLDVGPIGDDFLTLFRFPVLVTMRAGDKEFHTTTSAFSTAINPVLVAKYPYFGACIGDEGLETLEFVQGEEVEVTMTVYDHAGNAAEPVVQTIAWPIETGSGGTAGSAGSTPNLGGAEGSASNPSTGCSATPNSPEVGLSLLCFGLLALSLWFRRTRTWPSLGETVALYLRQLAACAILLSIPGCGGDGLPPCGSLPDTRQDPPLLSGAPSFTPMEIAPGEPVDLLVPISTSGTRVIVSIRSEVEEGGASPIVLEESNVSEEAVFTIADASLEAGSWFVRGMTLEGDALEDVSTYTSDGVNLPYVLRYTRQAERPSVKCETTILPAAFLVAAD